MVEELSEVMAGWGLGFSRSMADMVVNSRTSFDSIKTSFRGLLVDIVAMQMNKQFTKPVIAAGSDLLEKAVGSITGGIFGGSAGGAIGGDMDTGAGAGLVGGGGLFGGINDFFSGLGFANGGSFSVAGAGGTDSQYVNFMATPGERVTVETPAQQMAARREAATPMQVNHFHITGPIDRRSQAQIASAAGEGLQRAMARNT